MIENKMEPSTPPSTKAVAIILTSIGLYPYGSVIESKTASRHVYAANWKVKIKMSFK